MAFHELESFRTISCLDLYGFILKNKNLREEAQEYNFYGQSDTEEAIKNLPQDFIYKVLWQMGVNTQKEVEEKVVLHRPNCLSYSTQKENKPVVEALCFFGSERQDREWKLFKTQNSL
ncbi:MAG: hypothetical protein GOVbin4162_53 [Prokaryotic dsDNA virus sp.]|nr:MAG: hypothetical protein GOVbin4162_53 [Prokaryotic dsDNA virus sp.]|tara:strand:- start:2290 stop:2643 length:354 start_codon:yes stop_codon:yes gene_type:complete